jgi:hypothetical protein
MSLRLITCVCALLASAAARADDVSSVKLSELARGSRFRIATAEQVYRGELIDPATGETKLAVSDDGQQFSPPRIVYVLGATHGQSADSGGLMLVKMNRLQAGLRMELGIDSLDERDRRVTEPVKSIRIE